MSGSYHFDRLLSRANGAHLISGIHEYPSRVSVITRSSSTINPCVLRTLPSPTPSRTSREALWSFRTLRTTFQIAFKGTAIP